MNDLTITLIQTNLVWEDKNANLQLLEEKIGSIREKTHIVILPEMFFTGFSMHPEQFAETMDGTTIGWMKKIAQEKKIILTGSVIVEEDGSYFNRMVWMMPNGQYCLYDKRHLFGYAGEDKHYSAGEKRVIVSVNGWRILLQVCYDLRFPVWARQQSTKEQLYEYDAIIYVANWPEKRNLAWKTLLQARAIENMSFVVGVNRVGNDGNGFHHSGDSRIIHPLGTLLYDKTEEEDVFTYTLEANELLKTRDRFPFAKDADHFKIFN
ncbi:MAG: amidohydrolase [Pseudopedobacter saltans]|uniref:Omega-amidase YafV n=1 Tax=Pseudopedobacter saltans TaxID=151895 RepID=A0A2W5GRW6_9SPHI|nr:MAG: amidohydrolase [Pseudopedobacter saltans]